MNLKEAASSSGIPVPVIRRLQKEGLLREPLDEDGIRDLSFLGSLWGRRWFAGAVLRGIRDKRDRFLLALFPEYGKMDFYVLKSYLVGTGEIVSVPMLQHRIRRAFSVEISEERILKLRQTAYDIRRGRLKLRTGTAVISYADLLGIPGKQD